MQKIISANGAQSTHWVCRTDQLMRATTPTLAYGALITVFAWYGGMKFTAYEAEGIRPILASSPFFSPLLDMFGTQGTSNIIGGIEITIAGLLAARPISARSALIGGIAAFVTFLITLSFLFTTPGVIADEVGPLALSAGLGLFLLKDAALLALSATTMQEAAAALIAHQR